MKAATKPVLRTAFETIGGETVVRALVDRFYDLMDEVPEYHALRALHQPDLAPMRDSLTGFLVAWLGGPRSWFEQHPGVCIMSAHGRLSVDARAAGQWTGAMSRAVADIGVDPELAFRMNDAFARMATAMRNH